MTRSAAERFPTRHRPPVTVRDLPPPPRSAWSVIGPGIVAASVGIGTGELILYPYIATQVGLGFLWAAVISVLTKYFINMEIERYTLATGETVLAGFSRFWRHWGLVFALMIYIESVWPGWASSSAKLVSYLFGIDQHAWVTIGILVAIGLALTLSPVIYNALERVAFFKVTLIILFGVLATVFVITAEAWAELPRNVTAPELPIDLGAALILSAIVFAGTGGGANLAQGNWIRDKRYGMGANVPRLVSPLTGKEEAAEHQAGFIFEPTDENLRRWRRWWRLANWEQLGTFVIITLIAILLASLIAFSTVSRDPSLVGNISFLQREGERLKESVGTWFGTMFWIIGALSLFGTATGVVDFTSRLTADVLKASYLRRFAENRIYVALVWGLILIGSGITLTGLEDPLPLLEISASIAALSMCIYSVLLLVLNRRVLAEQIRPRRYRVAALTWSAGLFGGLAAVTIWQQGQKFLGNWLN